MLATLLGGSTAGAPLLILFQILMLWVQLIFGVIGMLGGGSILPGLM